MVICLEQGADCLHMVQMMPLHPQTPSSLASLKSRLVYLSGTYRLTQVVLEKRPLNGCSSSLIVVVVVVVAWLDTTRTSCRHAKLLTQKVNVPRVTGTTLKSTHSMTDKEDFHSSEFGDLTLLSVT